MTRATRKKRRRRRTYESYKLPENVQVCEDATQLGDQSNVDRKRGLIKNVKVTGYESKNIGRTIGIARGPASTMAYRYDTALDPQLYEGVKIRIDHPQFEIDSSGKRVPKNGGERSVLETFGELHNVRRAEDGLYGDIQANTDDRDYDQLMTLAEQFPNQLAMSHNARGTVKLGDDQRAIVTVDGVESVDLVGSNPGTTKNLFEQFDPKMFNKKAAKAAGEVKAMVKKRKKKKPNPLMDEEVPPVESEVFSMSQDNQLLEQINNLENRLLAVEDYLEKRDTSDTKQKLLETHGVDTHQFKPSHLRLLENLNTEPEILDFIEQLPPVMKRGSVRGQVRTVLESSNEEDDEILNVKDFVARSRAI